MNLRAAKYELGEPPKIGLHFLALETVAVVTVSYILVGLVG